MMAVKLCWQPSPRQHWRPLMWSDLGYSSGRFGKDEQFAVEASSQAHRAIEGVRAYLPSKLRKTARIKICDE